MNDITNEIKPKKSIKIIEARFKEASFARNQWRVAAEYGTTLDDIKKPEYWAHVAKNLKPGDEISVLADDMTFKVNLDVLDASRTGAKVFVVDYIDYTINDNPVDFTTDQDPEYEIKYAGPHLQHQVIRLSDRSVIKENLALRGDAEAWLKEHLKTITR